MKCQAVHVAVFLECEIDRLAIAGELRRVEHDDIEALAVGNRVAQPGEQVGLDVADVRVVELGIRLGQFERAFIEVEANDFVRVAESLRIDAEAAGVAADVEHAFAAAELGEALAVVALIEKEARLVLAARRDAKLQPVLENHVRRRRLRSPAIERFLLPHVLFREPVELGIRVVNRECIHDRAALLVHPGSEEFEHDRVAEAIDDEPAEVVALRMHEAVGVGDGIELEYIPAKGDGRAEFLGKERGIDLFFGIAGEQPQRDARVAVVEAAADPAAAAIADVHDGTRRDPPRGLLDHLLEDPRVRRTPLDLERDRGKGSGVVVGHRVIHTVESVHK